MTYVVKLQNASGTQRDVTVTADTDERACHAALRQVSNEWRAVRAIPMEWVK